MIVMLDAKRRLTVPAAVPAKPGTTKKVCALPLARLGNGDGEN
jgi:hypothetical protein